MSRSLTRAQALVLAATVLTGLALATAGLFAVGSRQWLWGDSFHVRVQFRQIRGVEPGTRVRVLGKEAGVVEEVRLPDTPSGEVTLRLRLDSREMRRLVRKDATAQIVAEGMVGGKVIEILPGSDAAGPVDDDAVIASQPTAELTDLLGEVGSALQGISNGKGSLGKLVNDPTLYQQGVKLLEDGQKTMALLQQVGVRVAEQSQGTMTALRQDADAIRAMPIIRGYVQDPHKLLVRPDCERNRRWFAEADLFEPGHAVLTSPGKKRLDDLVPWLEGLKHKGSEVVIVAYAAPAAKQDVARTLTQKQSEAVYDYLTGNHAVQKMGWFSRRKVTPVGMGTDPPPESDRDSLPPARVEVLVFVPQG